MKIPKAREAVDAEWTKLQKARAWMEETVTERSTVEARAEKEGKTIHFATLMDLCHVKHSELPEAQRKYKGRVVCRGISP